MGPHSIAASVKSAFSSESQKTSINSERPGSTHNDSIVHSNRSHIGPGSHNGNANSECSSSEESDDEEMFSYTRVTKSPPSFLKKDRISACLIHSKLHVYATDSGIVHITTNKGEQIRTVRVHRSSVLGISVDPSGDYIATASIDGTVMVASVKDSSDTIQANFKRPVHAIASHPDYATTRSYISGGTAGQILLSERGWSKSRADTVSTQTNSTISALSWTQLGLIWCNDDGITIYDMESRSLRATIPPTSENEESIVTSGYVPRSYIDGDKALIAWANNVFTIDIRNGKLIKKLSSPYKIAGAVPFHQSQTIVSAVNSASESVLRVIADSNGVELYADELEMRSVLDGRMNSRLKDINQTVINQYHLLAQGPTTKKSEDTQLWIVNSKDAIIARERNVRDHLNWLVEHEKFVEAYQAAKSTTKIRIETDETSQLGRQAVEQLIDKNQFEPAAHILSQILSASDTTDWLLWSNKFLNARQALVLGEVIPTGTKLEGHIHDAILAAAIVAGDYTRLRTWIHSWPLEVYDAQALAEKLESTLDSETSPQLNQEAETNWHLVYADVSLKLGEYVKAVKALIKANSSKAFRVVCHYHLWSEPEIVKALSAILISGDGDLGDGGYVDRIRESIGARAEISPIKVVHQSQNDANQDSLLFGYSSELRLVDETLLGEKPLVDLMIKLYAKYDNQRLLGFLEKFDTYDIDASIAMCRELGLTNESVYLLGRLGQSKEALSLIVTQLQDYDRAVAFARTQDPEIWDQLVGYASQSPDLVLTLLKCVEVSPARVLSMVPANMHIPGLKSALCRVSNGQEVSVALHRGASKIVHDESCKWMESLRAERLRGIACETKEMEVQIQTQLGQDDDWKSKPALISESSSGITYECVDLSRGNFNTLSGKIAHLRRISVEQ